MFLNQRSINILKELIHHNKTTVDIENLARKYHVSERSIRYDLELIDDFLRKKELPILQRQAKVEVSINNEQISKQNRSLLLNELRTENDSFSPKERRQRIFIDILYQGRVINIDYLEKRLDVSRSTIVSDIRTMKEELNEINGELYYSPQKGYSLEGDERKIRRKTLNILSNHRSVCNYIEDSIRNKYWSEYSIDDLFLVEALVTEIEKHLKKTYSGNAFINLVNGVLMVLSRIRQKHLLQSDANVKQLKTKEYKKLVKRFKNIEIGQRNIVVPDKEIWFLMTLFLEGNLVKSERYLNENWLTLYLLIDQFIYEMSQKLNVRLDKDTDLFNALVLHLGPAINRLENEMYLKNEIIQYIKNTYFELFNMVGNTLNKLVEEREITFSSDEIGFITLHVASALEKISMNEKKPNVLIVCNYGIGTSNLLETRIKKHLSFNVEKTISVRKLNKSLLANRKIDLIISTVPINEVDYPPIIEVSPLLNKNEIKKLKEFEENISSSNTSATKKQKSYRREWLPMLRDLLVYDTVRTNVKVRNWEEAVRFGGKLLKDRGVIKQKYIETMVNTVKELGTYIVIAPNIAMPHASSKDGVNEIGLSLITLKNPVEFGHPENDPVKIVICLAAVDHSSHLKALQDLMDFLKEEKFINFLKEEAHPEAIIDYIDQQGGEE